MRPLKEGKQKDVVSMLQKGCSVRDVVKTLNDSKSSVQRLHKKHVPDAKL